MVDLQQGEFIVAYAHKHWLIFALEIIGIIGGTLALFALVASLEVFAPELVRTIFTDSSLLGFNLVASVFIIMCATITIAITFTNYYLDVLVVTNRRLIDCDQIGLFSRDVATIPTGNIIDIKIIISGILETFFNFGDLSVQSAGVSREVVIRGLSKPQHVKQIIFNTFTLHPNEIPHQKYPTS